MMSQHTFVKTEEYEALKKRVAWLESLFQFEDEDDVMRTAPNDPITKDAIIIRRDYYEARYKQPKNICRGCGGENGSHKNICVFHGQRMLFDPITQEIINYIENKTVSMRNRQWLTNDEKVAITTGVFYLQQSKKLIIVNNVQSLINNMKQNKGQPKR